MEVVVDVREPGEYAEGHVAGALNLPTSNFGEGLAAVARLCEGGSVRLVCKSGVRSGAAREQLLKAYPDLADKVTACADVGDGRGAVGGNPPIPIIRQVMLVAGVLIIGFGLAAALVDSRWAWGDVAVGAGLFFAGATGFCGMALLLQRMPWNSPV